MKRFALLSFVLVALQQSVLAQDVALPVKWDVEALCEVPEMMPMPKLDSEGIKAALLQGISWRGDDTRFFVYYGIPEGADETHPVPAMVLIHGGGGTARWQWVKQWVDRGYAAIAMANNGQLPVKVEGSPFDKWADNWTLLPGGIHLDCGDFEHGLRPVEEQWAYCAVADIMLAHSFLRSLPGVDPDRIGVTGNSWGGFLTILSAAVDKRYKFAAPVYGCGFYDEFDHNDEQEGDAWHRWLKLWDPRYYIPSVEVPLLWACGNKDFYFSFGALQKSFALARTSVYKAVRSPMVHTDGGYDGGVPEETFSLADHFFKGGKDLPKVSDPVLGKKGRVSVTFDAAGRIPDKVEMLCMTTDEGPWEKRQWTCSAIPLPKKGNAVIADIPEDAKAFYFNLTTADGLVASSSALFATPSGFAPAPVDTSSSSFVRPYAEPLLENDWIYHSASPEPLRVAVCGNDEDSAVEVTMRLRTDLDEEVLTSSMKGRTGDTLNFFLSYKPGIYKVSLYADEALSREINVACDLDDIVCHPDPRPDFDAFWSETLNELAEVPMDVKWTRLEDRCNSEVETFRLDFDSFGGEHIAGILMQPVAEGRYPARIVYHGYGCPAWYPPLDAYPGQVVLSLSIRDQALNYKEPNDGRWICRGVDDPHKYYYRGAYMDAVRGVDVLCSLPKVDADKVFAEGGSQGGGLTFAAAALDPRIKAAAPYVPFMGDVEHFFDLVPWLKRDMDSAVESLGMDKESLYRNLSYFDLKNLAGNVKCPIVMAFGLQDPLCPPRVNFAIYNNLETPKKWIVYPAKGHGVGESWTEIVDGLFDAMVSGKVLDY